MHSETPALSGKGGFVPPSASEIKEKICSMPNQREVEGAWFHRFAICVRNFCKELLFKNDLRLQKMHIPAWDLSLDASVGRRRPVAEPPAWFGEPCCPICGGADDGCTDDCLTKLAFFFFRLFILFIFFSVLAKPCVYWVLTCQLLVYDGSTIRSWRFNC